MIAESENSRSTGSCPYLDLVDFGAVMPYILRNLADKVVGFQGLHGARLVANGNRDQVFIATNIKVLTL